MSRLSLSATRIRRLLLRYRRLLAAALAAGAMLAAVNAVAPTAPLLRPVAVAAHDLDGGLTIAPGDVRVVEMRPGLTPIGAAAGPEAWVGHRLAAPMRAGEPFTDRRVVSVALLRGYANGLVAAPVRIDDREAVGLLHVGDHIDVYAATQVGSISAAPVATDAAVVLLPPPVESSSDGALVVLAVTPETARRLA
ncbi:MAG: SAF domain-containing protein, partial [Nocardioidaceae bacterium]